MSSDDAACCPECRGESVWVDQVSSRICTQCGTLLDPTQSVLSSHLEQNENYIRHSQFDPLWSHASLPRSRNGWRLPGQGKDVRDAAHMVRHSPLALGGYYPNLTHTPPAARIA